MKGRTIIIFILTVLIILTQFTGCRKKVEEKIAEKFVENVVGGQVDIDKDTTTIKSEYGETIVGENLKWPKEGMGNLPELKANITMINEDKDKTFGMVYFDDIKKDYAEKYLKSIIDLNYKSEMESTSEEGFLFIGSNDDGSQVSFTYSNNGSGSISYTQNSTINDLSSSGDSTQNPIELEEIDMTDDVQWPKDFFNDIPELEGKITEVSSNGNEDKFVYIEYVTKEDAIDYVEKLKQSGFELSPYESITGDYINYDASSENEDFISFNWSIGGYVTINYTKSQ